MDIKFDSQDSDAIFVNGPLTKADVTQPFTENVRQRLLIRLRTFRGEWFLSTQYGVPWFQEVLGRKTTKTRVDQLLQESILSEQGVVEILTFKSTFINRVYSLSFSVRCRNGGTATLTINDIGA